MRADKGQPDCLERLGREVAERRCGRVLASLSPLPIAGNGDLVLADVRPCPFKIVKLITDKGSQFTDRCTSRKKDAEGNPIPSGKHVFDRLCKTFDIEHRLIPPGRPQTNGVVERFNGRISEVVKQTRFASTAELESTLRGYLKIYNHSIPQGGLNHVSPIQALKEWQKKKPELFVKRVYNHISLDTYIAQARKCPLPVKHRARTATQEILYFPIRPMLRQKKINNFPLKK